MSVCVYRHTYLQYFSICKTQHDGVCLHMSIRLKFSHSTFVVNWLLAHFELVPFILLSDGSQFLCILLPSVFKAFAINISSNEESWLQHTIWNKEWWGFSDGQYAIISRRSAPKNFSNPQWCYQSTDTSKILRHKTSLGKSTREMLNCLYRSRSHSPTRPPIVIAAVWRSATVSSVCF